MSKKTGKSPTEQGDYEVGNKRPPKNRQFGQPEGNPRNPGGWKKSDTPRYKLERMITLSRPELQDILDNDDAPEFERAVADILLQVRDDVDKDGVPRPSSARFKTLGDMINQVYGSPAQTTVAVNADMDEDDKAGFIKGIFIPGSGDDAGGAGSSR